jgi:CHAD domain-containing protein
MARRPSAGASERFLRQYDSASKEVRDALRDYLGDPSESSAHALRSGLRRLDAALRVLPKRVRKEEPSLEDYEARCSKVLKLTSPIRDVDMLTRKLMPLASDPSIAAIAKKVRSQRQKHIDGSMKAAWKLFETRPPKLDPKKIPGLDAHVRRVAEELEAKVAKDLSKTLASESRVDELHSLRKRCKRLRYTLVFLPGSPKKDERSRLLRAWQDSLGAIRDSDVLIERLGRKDRSQVGRELLRQERLKRHAAYVRFVKANGAAQVPGGPEPRAAV